MKKKKKRKSPVHTAAAPAVRAAVKTELSYRNDTKIAFFFTTNKNKHDY